jgi:integrase
MAGTVRHARLESVAARSRLKRGRQPHWQALVEGKIHLGWQCWKKEPTGRWLLRRYIGDGKYRIAALGLADDSLPADGVMLSHAQAEARARSMVAIPGKIEGLTVRRAVALYCQHKRQQGLPVDDTEGRARVHILPALGDLVVVELTTDVLRQWLATMAAAPAQNRAKDGKPQFRAEPKNEDDIRRRRATGNRVLSILKAILNFAYDEGHVASRDAWGRKLKPFEQVDAARIRYLSIAESQRLLNAADADFRPLVRAALETGARYGELARLEVADFNVDAGSVHVRKSKSGKERHIILTEEGAGFFRQQCAGRHGHERLFVRAGGSPWIKSSQKEPMREAVTRAKISPPITFHGLRHTWASHAVMNGVPLMVVARNLGHRDTSMVEKHYGHLAPSFVQEAIRAGAPRYGITEPSSVVPMPTKT